MVKLYRSESVFAQDENLIATAATNGAVVLWNLGKSSRSKQLHVFTEHTRTVNKVFVEIF